MLRFVRVALACLFLCLLATPVAQAAGSPGHPSLAICYFSNTGQCSTAAGWMFQTGQSDSCGATLLWSQGLNQDIAVWVDDSLTDSRRQSMVNCEHYSLGRPYWYVFAGRFPGQSCCNFSGEAEQLGEWYPWHLSALGYSVGAWGAQSGNPKPYSYWGCPSSSWLSGFVTQQNFSWGQFGYPGGGRIDWPPSSSEAGQEWSNALACIPAGQLYPMGTY